MTKQYDPDMCEVELGQAWSAFITHSEAIRWTEGTADEYERACNAAKAVELLYEHNAQSTARGAYFDNLRARKLYELRELLGLS